MAFTFQLSTDAIRTKMFDFIKPVYRNTWDFKVDFINWTYGVYEEEHDFFITYVNSDRDDDKYVILTGNDEIFYVSAYQYQHTLSEVPEQLAPYRDTIQAGIKFYNNPKAAEKFKSSFCEEQEKKLREITENMKDQCRPNFVINSYEDAVQLFQQEDFNFSHISRMYNKNTVAAFEKYLPDEKMRSIRGEKYREILAKISDYPDALCEADYTQISKDFQQAENLVICGIDDTYIDITFPVIQKAYCSGVISCGYVDFLHQYMKSCIHTFPDDVPRLRPLLDFVSSYMQDRNFKSLEFYRKELERRIYQKVEGFQFICTTDAIREKMFDFLKPEYKSKYDLHVSEINWETGVFHPERGIFLTLIYYVSDGIARCGINYSSYLVLTEDGAVFQVDNNEKYEKKTYDFRIPKQYEALTDCIKEGIRFYQNNAEYRSNLSPDTRKQLKAIKKAMDDRCHRNFPIHCAEDAHKLFLQEDSNLYKIQEIYNKQTLRDFKKFAAEESIVLWQGDKYLQLLTQIANRKNDARKCRWFFRSACEFFNRGVNDTYDKQFFAAVKFMYTSHFMEYQEEHILTLYLNRYAETYPDVLDNLIPLIAFLESHTENESLKSAIENVKKLQKER